MQCTSLGTYQKFYVCYYKRASAHTIHVAMPTIKVTPSVMYMYIYVVGVLNLCSDTLNILVCKKSKIFKQT